MAVLVILGAAVWRGGPSPALLRRAQHGAALWQPGDRVICCGGTGRHPPSEAEAIAAILRAQGIPGDAILLEDRSATTWENIALALPLLDRLGVRAVTIVTDGYHATRARMVARHHGLAARSDCPQRGDVPLGRRARAWLREAAALPVYALRLRLDRVRRSGPPP